MQDLGLNTRIDSGLRSYIYQFTQMVTRLVHAWRDSSNLNEYDFSIVFNPIQLTEGENKEYVSVDVSD